MDDLEARLHAAGAAFRTEHNRAASPRRTTRRVPVWLLPMVAASATVAIAVSAAVLLPSDAAPQHIVPARTAVELTGVGDAEDTAVDERWVVVVTSAKPGTDSVLQVRHRPDLNLVSTIPTRFAHGGPTCPLLQGDDLFYVDEEVIPSSSVPGPVGRSTLLRKDLRTGKTTALLRSGSAPNAQGYGRLPCPVVDGSRVAWQPDDLHASVLNLATGTTRTTPADGQLVGLLDGELVLARSTDLPQQPGHPVNPTQRMTVHAGARTLAVVPGGTSAALDSHHLVVFAQKRGSDTNDGQLVSLCTLPACSDLHQIADDPGSGNAVVGDTFVAWSSLLPSPVVRTFAGAPGPGFGDGYVPFRSLSAYGDTLVYAQGQASTDPPYVLHVVRVGQS